MKLYLRVHSECIYEVLEVLGYYTSPLNTRWVFVQVDRFGSPDRMICSAERLVMER